MMNTNEIRRIAARDMCRAGHGDGKPKSAPAHFVEKINSALQNGLLTVPLPEDMTSQETEAVIGFIVGLVALSKARQPETKLTAGKVLKSAAALL
jgi:hypothetical protein